MVLPIRGLSSDRVPLEDFSGNPSEHQMLLARFFTDHRIVGPAVRVASERLSGNLRAAFHSLSLEEQSHLREIHGPANVETILNLAMEADPQLFYEDFFHLGLAYEQEDQFSFAALIYDLLAESAPDETLRQRAVHRGRVVRGEGPLGDHLEFLSGQFMKQLTDPAMFAGMFAAGWSFGRVSSWALNSFATRNFASRAMSWGLGFGAEINAFTFTVRGVRHLQGVSQDWSGTAVAQDLGRTGIMLAFLKGSGAVSQAAVGRIPATATTFAGFSRFSHQALPQLFMYAGLLGAHSVEQFWGLSAPTAHPLLDSLVTLLHFNIAGSLLNRVMPQQRHGPFRDTDYSARLLHRTREWIPQRAPVLGLVTPEGFRIEPRSYNMSHDGSQGSGSAERPGSGDRVLTSGLRETEGAEGEALYLAPMKFNPQHFEAVRDQYYISGNRLYSLINEQFGKPLWYLQFRNMGLQFQALARQVQVGLTGHPASKHIEPVLRNLDGELNGFNRLLHASEKAFPVDMELPRVHQLARLLYPNPNVMVNFIHSGRMSHLQQVLRSTAASRLHLQEMLEGLKPMDLPSAEPSWVGARDFLGPDPANSKSSFRGYDWAEYTNDQFRDVEGTGNRLLLLGPKGEFRPSAFSDQKATQLDRRLLRLDEISELSRALSGDRNTPLEGTFDFLEAHDLLRPEVIQSPEGEIAMRVLATRLKPGGVGYLVHRDAQTVIGMAELLARHQLGDVIEASLGTPLPVPSARSDAEYSNYLFFRRLPYR